MKITIFVVLLMVCAVLSESTDFQWRKFKLDYNKGYKTPAEEESRKTKFIQNLNSIEEHNKRYEQGLESYTQGVTQFVDLTPEEFEKCFNDFDYKAAKKDWDKFDEAKPADSEIGDSPGNLDWSKLGAVTNITLKKRGKCGESWAFSAAATIEGAYFIKTKKLVKVSEQNLIDCAYLNDHGEQAIINTCKVGSYSTAFEYVLKSKGIDHSEHYPYNTENASPTMCIFEIPYVGAQIQSYSRIQSGNEEILKFYAGLAGPISVAVNNRCFHMYKDGIVNCEPCGARLNHAVTIIGYGTEKGLDYWLVKNSWGNTWGEKGYIRISRNKNNQCGIASMAMFVLA